MNEVVHKFLLLGKKLTPGIHLRQPGFTYGACGPFTNNKERIQKFKETGAIFTVSTWYDLPRRIASDKVLRDRAFNIAKKPKQDEYQKGIVFIVYNFFDKKFALLADKSAACSSIKNISNEKLAEELDKPIIRKFEQRKLLSSFKEIFGVLIFLTLIWKMSIIKVTEIFQYHATNEKWCPNWISLMKKCLVLFHFHFSSSL